MNALRFTVKTISKSLAAVGHGKGVAGLIIVALLITTTNDIALADDPQDILVIANNSVGQKNISKSELREVFLKKKTNWRSGGKIVPIHATEGSALRTAFRSYIIGMSRNEEQRYWQQFQIKSGEPQPTAFANPLKAVYKVRGAVSYIYRSQYRPGAVKVLMVIPAS